MGVEALDSHQSTASSLLQQHVSAPPGPHLYSTLSTTIRATRQDFQQRLDTSNDKRCFGSKHKGRAGFAGYLSQIKQGGSAIIQVYADTFHVQFPCARDESAGQYVTLLSPKTTTKGSWQ